MKSLSIITPILNGEKYLERLLQSIRIQKGIGSEFTLEHILCDGGSTDGSTEILNRYADAVSPEYTVRILFSQDRGQVDALNLGIMMAKGHIIGIANADDFYEPSSFSMAIRLFERFSTTNLFVYGGCRVIDQNCSIYTLNRAMNFVTCSLGRHPINPISYFYTKNIHYSLGLYNELYPLAHDLDFLLKVSKHVKTIRLNRILGTFVIHHACKTHLSNETSKGQLEFEEVVKSSLAVSSMTQRILYFLARTVLKSYLLTKKIMLNRVLCQRR